VAKYNEASKILIDKLNYEFQDKNKNDKNSSILVVSWDKSESDYNDLLGYSSNNNLCTVKWSDYHLRNGISRK